MSTEPASSKPFLSQLSELIDEVCKKGQTVNDIAIRAGLSRDLVSRIKNRSYRSAPSLSNIEAVCLAIGHRLAVVPMEADRAPRPDGIHSES
jgi:DNA-binding phage protein